MKSRRQLTLSFLGGASEIGASCTLIEVAGKNLLVYCGVRFRIGDALPDLASLGAIRPDAILVTHAHSDHSGGLPVVADTFRGHPSTRRRLPSISPKSKAPVLSDWESDPSTCAVTSTPMVSPPTPTGCR